MDGDIPQLVHIRKRWRLLPDLGLWLGCRKRVHSHWLHAIGTSRPLLFSPFRAVACSTLASRRPGIVCSDPWWSWIVSWDLPGLACYQPPRISRFIFQLVSDFNREHCWSVSCNRVYSFTYSPKSLIGRLAPSHDVDTLRSGFRCDLLPPSRAKYCYQTSCSP